MSVFVSASFMSPRLWLGMLSLCLALGAQAGMYKWVDKDGNVHYGDTPPRDVTSQPLRTPKKPPATPARTDSQGKQQADDAARREAEFRDEIRQKRQQKEQAAEDRRKAQEQRCLNARKRYAVLQEEMPVYIGADGEFHAKWFGDSYKGERKYFDDATRAKEEQRAVRDIATYCDRPGDMQEQQRVRDEWVDSEYCASVRGELEAMEKPGSRASKDALTKKRRQVAEACKQ